MKIIVDAMGGDHAPGQIMQGCAQAVREYGVEIILCGRKDILERVFAEQSVNRTGMEIVDAPDVIEMTDDSDSVVKEKNQSSMAIGLKLLKEGRGDAFVCAGNTGALIVGSTLIVKRIRGVNRAAIASVLPCSGGKAMLIDSGANAECTPEFLSQFAVMGSVYMNGMYGIENPRIGLLNNGAEETKGTPVHTQAHALLRENEHINFIGNIEGRDGPLGAADVIVADGFSGNIYLKSLEGMGKMISQSLKGVFYKNVITKLGALMCKKEFMAFK